MRAAAAVTLSMEDRVKLIEAAQARSEVPPPMNRLAFLVTVGEFSGLASWQMVTDVIQSSHEKLGLRWQPRVDEADHFRFDCDFDGHNWWSERMCKEKVGNTLLQSIHVIDMLSFECVQLLKDASQSSIEILESNFDEEGLEAGDLLTYPGDLLTHHHMLFRHNYRQHFVRSPSKPWRNRSSIEACVLEPFATLRPVVGSDDVFRLHSLDLEFQHAQLCGVKTPEHLCDVIADVVKQTHAPVTSSPGDEPVPDEDRELGDY